jgi:hypothetical protein
MVGMSWDEMKAWLLRNGAEHCSGSTDASEVIVSRTALSPVDVAGEEKLP